MANTVKLPSAKCPLLSTKAIGDKRYYSFKIREATFIKSEHLTRRQEVRGLTVRSPSILTEGIRGISQSHQLIVGTSFEQTMTTSFYKPSRLTTEYITHAVANRR